MVAKMAELGREDMEATMWAKVQQAQPRLLPATTYSVAESELKPSETLLLRVEMIVQGCFFPQRADLACWIPTSDTYLQVTKRTNGITQTRGFYAVDKDALLHALLGATPGMVGV